MHNPALGSAGLQARVPRALVEAPGFIPANCDADACGFSRGDSWGVYQGTTSQAAEKLALATDSYQGTTSVVPLSRLFFLFRAGFSPRGGIDACI